MPQSLQNKIAGKLAESDNFLRTTCGGSKQMRVDCFQKRKGAKKRAQYSRGRHRGRVAGKKWQCVMPSTNKRREKSFLRIAVNDVEPFPAGQPVERPGKGKNVQIDCGDFESAGPVNFVGNLRRNFLPRLFGIKHMNVAALFLQSASHLMDGDLTAALKTRPGRRKYGETDF